MLEGGSQEDDIAPEFRSNRDEMSDKGEDMDEGEGEEEPESEVKVLSKASTEQEEAKRAEIKWNAPNNLTAINLESLQSQDHSGINFGASDDSLQKMRSDKEIEVAPEVQFDRTGAEVQKRYIE